MKRDLFSDFLETIEHRAADVPTYDFYIIQNEWAIANQIMWVFGIFNQIHFDMNYYDFSFRSALLSSFFFLL